MTFISVVVFMDHSLVALAKQLDNETNPLA